MKLGMIGLGKMGFNLVQNLLSHQHQVVVYDVNSEPRQKLAELGAMSTASIIELFASLEAPRVVWIMVPAGEVVDGVIDALIPILTEGDRIIDGGNSHYKESLARAEKLREQWHSLFRCRNIGRDRRCCSGRLLHDRWKQRFFCLH